MTSGTLFCLFVYIVAVNSSFERYLGRVCCRAYTSTQPRTLVLYSTSTSYLYFEVYLILADKSQHLLLSVACLELGPNSPHNRLYDQHTVVIYHELYRQAHHAHTYNTHLRRTIPRPRVRAEARNSVRCGSLPTDIFLSLQQKLSKSIKSPAASKHSLIMQSGAVCP